jgi:undecaprenyl-diphosphatase
LLASRQAYFPVDLAIAQNLQARQHSLLTILMRGVTALGNYPLPVASVAVAVAVFLVLRWRAEAVVTAGTLLSYPLDVGLKYLVYRPRPSSSLVHIDKVLQDYSFPSGHAVFFSCFYGLLAVLLLVRLPNTAERNVLVALCVAVIALGGLSRVYLGEHWPSDVLGGYLLGALWLAALLWVYRRTGRTRGALVTGFLG